MRVGQVQTLISRTSKKVMAKYTEPSHYPYHNDFSLTMKVNVHS